MNARDGSPGRVNRCSTVDRRTNGILASRPKRSGFRTRTKQLDRTAGLFDRSDGRGGRRPDLERGLGLEIADAEHLHAIPHAGQHASRNQLSTVIGALASSFPASIAA